MQRSFLQFIWKYRVCPINSVTYILRGLFFFLYVISIITILGYLLFSLFIWSDYKKDIIELKTVFLFDGLLLFDKHVTRMNIQERVSMLVDLQSCTSKRNLDIFLLLCFLYYHHPVSIRQRRKKNEIFANWNDDQSS